MEFAGQDLAHLPQPMHTATLISAQHPCTTLAAWRGQTFSHVPQATHFFWLTLAWRLDNINPLLRLNGHRHVKDWNFRICDSHDRNAIRLRIACNHRP